MLGQDAHPALVPFYPPFPLDLQPAQDPGPASLWVCVEASQSMINELREPEGHQLSQWPALQPPRCGATATQVPQACALLAQDVEEW